MPQGRDSGSGSGSGEADPAMAPADESTAAPRADANTHKHKSKKHTSHLVTVDTESAATGGVSSPRLSKSGVVALAGCVVVAVGLVVARVRSMSGPLGGDYSVLHENDSYVTFDQETERDSLLHRSTPLRKGYESTRVVWRP